MQGISARIPKAGQVGRTLAEALGNRGGKENRHAITIDTLLTALRLSDRFPGKHLTVVGGIVEA